MTPRSRPGMWVLPALAVTAVAGIAALSLSLEHAPASRQAAVLPGLTAEDAGGGNGVVVTSVQSSSAAAHAGIVVGDRITVIDRYPVTSLGAARAHLRNDVRPVIDMQLYHYHDLRNVRLVRAEEPQHVPQDPGRRR